MLDKVIHFSINNQLPLGIGTPELAPVTTGLGEIYQYVIHTKKGYEKKYSAVPPQNLVSISAPINGFLKSTEMLEGTHVHKGQVVAIIEHPDIVQLELDFIEAKNKYDVLDKEIIRQQELNKENANTTKILQQTQGDFNIAKAKYKALEERLRMAGINKTNVLSGNVSGVIAIVSPINGFVTKINVNIGKMISQQDVMFEIVDTEHLHAELTVFEKDITKIKEGQNVRFTLANNPDKELTATVHLIGRSLDNTRSIRIHCHLDKEDKDLLPGMFINAVIELTGANVKCINVDAVVKSDGSEFVFIKKNKVDLNFIKIEVKTGISDGKFIEIKPFEPIENTDEIVISGAFYLLSKIKMSSVEDACEK